jgi:hypothetical protein
MFPALQPRRGRQQPSLLHPTASRVSRRWLRVARGGLTLPAPASGS